MANGEVSVLVSDFLSFLNASPTAFHAVDEAKKRLRKAGYEQISEREDWKLEAGKKYFFTRNHSTIFAFAIGKKYAAGNGFHIIGAHTDSPCLKLKPVSKVTKGGYVEVGVQTYGGGLWHTWFDRDLTVAGRVIIREVKDGSVSYSNQLVRIEEPIMRIPTLAIHLDRNVNDGFKINTQSHLVPVLATSIKAVLNKVVAEHCPVESSSQTDRKKSTAKHHSLLLQMLADQLGCEPDDICDFELQACDTQPSIAAGALKEFVFSGRLDNLCMSFCSLKALIDATSSERDLEDETGIQMVALFDHEEVGSNSAQGAGSPVMLDTLLRATNSFTSDPKVLKKAIQRSFLVSADMAHALHPNYMDKHEDNHQPKLHGGLVIKDNANQRYATSAVTSFIFREIAAEHSLPVQDFVVRNDLPCGSTIGPILASGAGIRTVDVGAPQLSMHSIREMCAVDDVEHSFKHFKAFFQDFSHLDAKITVDVPVSLLPCSMDSTSNSATLAPKEFEGYDYDYEGQTRLCFCGLKAPRIMSWSEKDPGRRFFACPIYDPEKKKRQCKYFIWYDQDFSFKAKEVILWLHNTKIKLENELEDARNRIRALKDVLKRHQEKGEQ